MIKKKNAAVSTQRFSKKPPMRLLVEKENSNIGLGKAPSAAETPWT